MPSYRCSMCSVNWPMSSGYNPCPSCGAETWVSTNNAWTQGEIKDLLEGGSGESRSTKKEEFNKYYEERAAKRAKEIEDKFNEIVAGVVIEIPEEKENE